MLTFVHIYIFRRFLIISRLNSLAIFRGLTNTLCSTFYIHVLKRTHVILLFKMSKLKLIQWIHDFDVRIKEISWEKYEERGKKGGMLGHD